MLKEDYTVVRNKFYKKLKNCVAVVGKLNNNTISFIYNEGTIQLRVSYPYSREDFIPLFNTQTIDQLIIEPIVKGNNYNSQKKQFFWFHIGDCDLKTYTHQLLYACRLQKHKEDIKHIFIYNLRIPSFYAEILYEKYYQYLIKITAECVRITVKHFYSDNIKSFL